MEIVIVYERQDAKDGHWSWPGTRAQMSAYEAGWRTISMAPPLQPLQGSAHGHSVAALAASASDLLCVMSLKWRNGGVEPPWLTRGQSSLCLWIDRALQVLCTSQEFDRQLCHNFLYNLAPKRSVGWKWLTDRRLWPCSHRRPWAESQQAARPVFTFISLKDKARGEAFLLLESNTLSSVLYSRDANQIKWCPPPLANTRD